MRGKDTTQHFRSKLFETPVNLIATLSKERGDIDTEVKEEGGRRKEEGGRRKEEGGRRKEEGGRRKKRAVETWVLTGEWVNGFLMIVAKTIMARHLGLCTM